MASHFIYGNDYTFSKVMGNAGNLRVLLCHPLL